MIRTLPGFQRLKAFTGPADHARQDAQWQEPIPSGGHLFLLEFDCSTGFGRGGNQHLARAGEPAVLLVCFQKFFDFRPGFVLLGGG